MPIQIDCECGKTLRIKDELAGKRIRCPDCNEVLKAPRPADDAPDEAASMAVTVVPPPLPKTPRRPSYDEDDEDRPSRSRTRRDEEEDDDDRPRSRRRRADDEDDEDELPSIKKKRRPGDPSRVPSSDGIPASIGAGVLMMIGAVVWFVGGLAVDVLFYYPPILFVLGIVAVVRGAMKRE